jgi:isopentenyl diphosphate isomerase/L-lactate dehydrogenase-like FMN-dependent dehydrogenase
MINIEIAKEAKKKLSAQLWDYLAGGSDDEIALRRNRQAFQKWAFSPKVLKDVSQIDLKRRFLNLSLNMPVISAPIGGLIQFHADGDCEWARGIKQAGSVGVVSGASRMHPRQILDESGANLFYQLYAYGDEHWIKDQIDMVEACGYQALVVNVDSAYFGQRERDILNGYDSRQVRWITAAPPPNRLLNRCLDWHLLARIQSWTKLSVILKGLSHPEDAKKAIQMGVKALWISNHGGRQLDLIPSSLEQVKVLAPLCRKASIPLIMDGGIRRGSDVLLALLLGADLVALGRLPVYGLLVDGAGGVCKVMKNIEQELRAAMGLVGLTNLNLNAQSSENYLTRLQDTPLMTRWDALENDEETQSNEKKRLHPWTSP